MTVLENLQMGAITAEPAAFDDNLERVVTLFPRLKQRLAQRGGTLSGGEQQMLAIARALMSRPRLLLLDEPSLGLAPLIVRQIFDAIKALNRDEGLTVFLVEQNAFHALRLAHRGYVMVNGLITLSGSGRDLLERPEIKSAYLEGGRQRSDIGHGQRGFFADRPVLRRRFVRRIRLGHRHLGRRRGDAGGPGRRLDLAAVVASGGLFADIGDGRAVSFISACSAARCCRCIIIWWTAHSAWRSDFSASASPAPVKWSSNIIGSTSRPVRCAGAASRADVILRRRYGCRLCPKENEQ